MICSTLKAAAEDALDGVLLGPDANALARSLKPRRGAVEGLFCGGTLAAEAQLILLRAGRTVASNAPIPGAGPLTEAVLLGGVASHFPETTLNWDSAKLEFDLPPANYYLRRQYREGWGTKGLTAAA